MTEKCGAIGALTVGGRVVGQLRCELDAGHDEERRYFFDTDSHPWPVSPESSAWDAAPLRLAATPHAVTLTWTPEAAPDLDLFDPAESFDVEIPEPELRCGQCAGVIVDVGTPASGPCFVHRDSTPATRSHSVQW